MTTSNHSSVLKDVVAYIDVWSPDKRANYSKAFVKQLEEMGAQVSRTFNKKVTHVVFSNGHQATWMKAKKSNVHLVSVLWVGRCHDDGVHVDEELYPALNDESNPVLKNRKHRCMLPKDSPEKTLKNDRRMRKKLDKMMKDLAPIEPLVTDVSPIIIDQENGIIYSPGLKRSEYMAQRLKDMKDERENLSLTGDDSDDNASASVAKFSLDKEEERKDFDIEDHTSIEESQRKEWPSPSHNVPDDILNLPDSPDFKDKKDVEGNHPKTSRRTSVSKIGKERRMTIDSLESHRLNSRSDKGKNSNKKGTPSQIKSSSSTPSTPHVTSAKSFSETKSHINPDTVNSSSCLPSSAVPDAGAFEMSNKAAVPVQKTELKTCKRTRPSLSALIRSFTLSSDCKNVPPVSSDGDDVFEDYFSPANHGQSSEKSVLPDLSEIRIPFDLDPVSTKRKQRRSESTRSEAFGKKRRKLEGNQAGKNQNQQCNVQSESQSHQHKNSNESVDIPSTEKTQITKTQKQSTLVFSSVRKRSPDTAKERSSSASVQPTTKDLSAALKKNSEFNDFCHTLEGRGNEFTVAAAVTKTSSDTEKHPSKQGSLHKMVNKTKEIRTLVMTSMPTEKQRIVDQVVKTLGGFSVVDSVCESTTHVVSGAHKRTLNILLGIARGCWILSFEWILWCLEQRQWIPEEPYELSDQFPAAQICRLQRHLSAGEHQQDLFQDQPAMFVSQHSRPPTQSLVELIELCGGTVCKTVRQAGICIGKYNGRRPKGSRILSEQWVLDSITHLKQLSYDNYDLE
ncbi:microcephalin [Pholidichthys leucotaenia]